MNLRHILGGEEVAPSTTAIVPVKQTAVETSKNWLEKAKVQATGLVPDTRTGLALGAAGAILWRKHPVLGFLAGMAIGSNAMPIIKGEKRQEALRNLVIEAAAIGGAYLLDRNSVVGFLAGGVLGGVAASYIPGLPSFMKKDVA